MYLGQHAGLGQHPGSAQLASGQAADRPTPDPPAPLPASHVSAAYNAVLEQLTPAVQRKVASQLVIMTATLRQTKTCSVEDATRARPLQGQAQQHGLAPGYGGMAYPGAGVHAPTRPALHMPQAAGVYAPAGQPSQPPQGAAQDQQWAQHAQQMQAWREAWVSAQQQQQQGLGTAGRR
ncbi:hypothetical protein F751_6108 [Auxenochlorella protothecoides]|uniref:Uncharacterized protein n=1 Tax=Auxenochlorella protothecoides TaxID=3075 RepID=A0A087SHE8_AUXPR|nr:hypothetical protein F751_6108 [Auxenochlorella protothecoides]KFM25152.1 hypothetical protein F751_6108 [Auxenochlorella protothecoides]